MNYEVWLTNLETLKTKNDHEILKNLIAEAPNPNIMHLLEPKIYSLVIEKLTNIINKINKELTLIFADPNYLDLTLVTLKKEISFLINICQIKQLSPEIKTKLLNKIKIETNEVYTIIIEDADNIDPTGVLSMTIKSNRIKWKEE